MEWLQHLMRYTLSFFILLFIFSGQTSGQRILNQYDFNKGGYYICLLEGPIGKDKGVPVCPVDKNAVDTTSFYYTSDKAVLIQLQKELVLYQEKGNTGSYYQCGYPFWFCVFKEGKLLLKLPANIECGYMATSMGQMPFSSKTLKLYKKKFKPLVLKTACFSSPEERSLFLERVKKDPNVVSYKVLDQQSSPPFFSIETVQLK